MEKKHSPTTRKERKSERERQTDRRVYEREKTRYQESSQTPQQRDRQSTVPYTKKIPK